MGCISKGERLEPRALPAEKFDLPELGAGVYVMVRAMTARQILALRKRHGARPEVTEADSLFGFEVIACCAASDDGSLLYADAAEAADHLDLAFPTLQALVKKCLDVSGVENTEKN